MRLNVAYACNEAYIPHTGISLLSLLENNCSFDEIAVYFIAKDVSPAAISLLKELTDRYQREFIVIPFDDLCNSLNINSLGRHIETVYSKLFFTRIKDIDKIIYLDSDTIVNDSLHEMWNIDISDYLVAGVETYTVSSKQMLGLGKLDSFINDGVVILNLNLLRKENIEDEFVSSIAEFDGKPPVLSEGVINQVCKGKILSIHPKFNLLSGLVDYRENFFSRIPNYYPEKLIREAVDHPVIIHYLSAFYNRPWDINCTHPMKDLYLHYKSLSHWADIPLENKKLPRRLRMIKRLYQIFPAILVDFIRFIIKKKDLRGSLHSFRTS